MKKPPKTEKSRVKERKREDYYDTAKSSNMDQVRENYKGINFLGKDKETRHDGNSRIDASVTKRGTNSAVPDSQWEKIVNITPAGIPDDPAGAFLPMPGRIRPREHMKVNECDY